ncbi:unnamed protein product [Vicia faba]|uniref:Uncharacterized protein n=1 Tax=Vicia faba TaxID=3906 RepID=A0AAV0ZPH2_VICFA|nr:unnamed protein product [Vicia faba]
MQQGQEPEEIVQVHVQLDKKKREVISTLVVAAKVIQSSAAATTDGAFATSASTAAATQEQPVLKKRNKADDVPPAVQTPDVQNPVAFVPTIPLVQHTTAAVQLSVPAPTTNIQKRKEVDEASILASPVPRKKRTLVKASTLKGKSIVSVVPPKPCPRHELRFNLLSSSHLTQLVRLGFGEPDPYLPGVELPEQGKTQE